MRILDRTHESPGVEGGFTLLELMVVLLIMAVVITIAGSVLFSLSESASRNDAMIQIEQKTSTVLAQAARDIRSAHTISFPAGSSPLDEVELAVNQAAGGTSNIEWIYDPVGDTLTRYVQNAGGTFVISGPSITKVINGASGVFTYYNVLGTNIPVTATNNTIANCAARISLQVNESTSTLNVPTFNASEDVALTDQVEIISAPGNGQC